MDNINVTPRFVLAGEATFTVSNGPLLGSHFTYHVYRSKPTDEWPNPNYFMKVMTGPSNIDIKNDFTYLGVIYDWQRPDRIDPTLKATIRSRFTGNKQFLVAQWALKAIWQVERGVYTLPPGYSIKHIGKCGRCKRPLTTPESLDTGFGQECAEIVGVEWKQRNVQQPSLIGAGEEQHT